MCKFCDPHELLMRRPPLHIACQFCHQETRWMSTTYVYDVNKQGGIIGRYSVCIPCRNILDPKE